MAGAVIRNPTPDWLKPENASVFDSYWTQILRRLGRVVGADDPASQVMTPLMTEAAATGTELTAAAQAIKDAAGKGLTRLKALATGEQAALDLSHAAQLQRAAEQGFTVDAYRGAKRVNEEITIPAWFAGIEDANVYSGSVNPTARLFGDANVPPPPFQRGSQVQPVKLRIQNPKQVPFTEIAFPTPESLAKAKAEGFDALMYTKGDGSSWYVPLDLAQIRSRFAAFDPAKIGSKELLAGLGGGAVLLSQVGQPRPPEPR